MTPNAERLLLVGDAFRAGCPSGRNSTRLAEDRPPVPAQIEEILRAPRTASSKRGRLGDVAGHREVSGEDLQR